MTKIRLKSVVLLITCMSFLWANTAFAQSSSQMISPDELRLSIKKSNQEQKDLRNRTKVFVARMKERIRSNAASMKESIRNNRIKMKMFQQQLKDRLANNRQKQKDLRQKIKDNRATQKAQKDLMRSRIKR